eukprot:TRINITY_DN7426_c0_g1_i3.p2 TRINITY_DN7426_c0_g1~~TRINITY_DN7426_c0_g1_i3.p2  ORF type:complete len:181 (-),score=19.88 TRINITY_DN7426_c0_g1_i3:285-827(-)
MQESLLAAKTGNEPAVTKSQQFIQIREDFLLLDTPGILWPKQEYENSSYRLAATGAIKDTAMDYADVAFFAADFLKSHYPDLLMGRYELEELPSTEIDFFEMIGKKRGCLGAGGRVDLTKISELFVKDLRSGQLGKICMETPSMIEVEIAQQKEKEAQKNQAKNATKNVQPKNKEKKQRG